MNNELANEDQERSINHKIVTFIIMGVTARKIKTKNEWRKL